jgi:hypothetical protein
MNTVKNGIPQPKLRVGVWAKKYAQQAIKALKSAGYIVTKSESGIYECHLDGMLLFVALNGMDSYMVRYAEKLFDETKQLEF